MYSHTCIAIVTLDTKKNLLNYFKTLDVGPGKTKNMTSCMKMKLQ